MFYTSLVEFWDAVQVLSLYYTYWKLYKSLVHVVHIFGTGTKLQVEVLSLGTERGRSI